MASIPGSSTPGTGTLGAGVWAGVGMICYTTLECGGFHGAGMIWTSAERRHYHTPHVRRNHPRPALEQYPARPAGVRADRYDGIPAAAVRPPARARVPCLPRRDALTVRARPRDLPPRSAHPDPVRGAG